MLQNKVMDKERSKKYVENFFSELFNVIFGGDRIFDAYYHWPRDFRAERAKIDPEDIWKSKDIKVEILVRGKLTVELYNFSCYSEFERSVIKEIFESSGFKLRPWEWEEDLVIYEKFYNEISELKETLKIFRNLRT